MARSTQPQTRIMSRPQKTQPLKRKRCDLSPDPSESSASGSDNKQLLAGDDDGNDLDSEDDADAPRATQWAESDGDQLDDDDSDVSSVADEPLDTETSLRKDLSSMSFGTLLRARSALKDSDSDSDSESDSRSVLGSQGAAKESSDDDAPQASSSKAKHTIEKRSNKHAPTEVSSKRPVGRFRQIVETKKSTARDPRFNALTGPAAADEQFQSSYGFIPELHVSELATLKENLVRAKKLLANSPRDQREERGEEVQRLELAVRRMESIVQRERREKVERDALGQVRREEKEKRKHGKGEWHMKRSDEKELLLKARYADLAATGKRGAVQKAIERKQKKVAQKEKKSRPFPAPRREFTTTTEPERGRGGSRGGRGRGGSSRGHFNGSRRGGHFQQRQQPSEPPRKRQRID
ncbi:hypothetical protein BKA62DRAFT_692759 [Auriculariales sp. MPI-PUGE-AT-0066]|nr:hypothetical protein BKA62DRAFT_692759 [Auriculariales sp. MPI-PUGE-AT-0066]